MPSSTLAPRTRAWDKTKRRRSERVREIVNSFEEDEEDEGDEGDDKIKEEVVFLNVGETVGACGEGGRGRGRREEG